MQTPVYVKWNRYPYAAIAALSGLLVFLVFGLTSPVRASDPVPPGAELTEQFVFFYYKDLAAPRRFYGEILGLQPTYEDDWVTLYRVLPGAQVGVVKEGGTAQHMAQPQNAVMLSIVTNDVAAWNQRLKEFHEVKFVKELYDHDSAPIRALLIADPGGYTVEIFQWLKK